MKTHFEKLQIDTGSEFHVIDITSDVEKAVINAQVSEGFAIIYSPHTTCGVMVNEKESGLLVDLQETLRRLIPESNGYLHDDFNVRTENLHEDETENAYAHLRQMLAGHASEHVPVSGGQLRLGQWQRVMVIEFDRARPREILIQVCGA